MDARSSAVRHPRAVVRYSALATARFQPVPTLPRLAVEEIVEPLMNQIANIAAGVGPQKCRSFRRRCNHRFWAMLQVLLIGTMPRLAVD